MSPVLGDLVRHFALLSLLAFGGANAVVPEMHRTAVDVHGWMSSAEFADLFALAQAAPGPNMMIVTLIGLRAAGVSGALLATAAVCLPSCLLTFAVARAMDRFRSNPWRAVLQTALAPITVGLVLGTGWVLTRAADHSIPAYLLTAGTVVWLLTLRLSPLWLIAGGAALGLAGLV
ncbi:MAG: chromate transporter [Candidatus Rokubacteria bacterium]|nr:chromate transporter [Candidatus Rokubacteria bacterium]